MEADLGKESIKDRKIVLIDGLNVAYSRNDRKARLTDIVSTERALKKHFDVVETYIDASARYKIDDEKSLNELVKKNRIILCPAKVSADDLIWVRAVSLVNGTWV